jgi:hypothetical protein
VRRRQNLLHRASRARTTPERLCADVKSRAALVGWSRLLALPFTSDCVTMVLVRGDEERVVVAFCDWLAAEGWSTQREVEFVDVLATRGDEVMYVEAKGRTTDPGLDIDTMYGQLLRRMPGVEVGSVIFAVVVPDTALRAANRVPERVRQLLRIRVYGVTEDGSVVVPAEPARRPTAGS